MGQDNFQLKFVKLLVFLQKITPISPQLYKYFRVCVRVVLN